MNWDKLSFEFLNMRNTFLLLFLLFAFQLGAQSFNIRGIVFNESDEALIGANIILLTNDSTIYKQVTSDLDGRFLIPDIQQGIYNLEISYIGYTTYKSEVLVNEPIRLGRIQLKEGSVGLEEVVVEGKVPLAVQKGDTTSYSASNYKVLADASSEDLVKKLPGVSMNNGSIQAEGENVQQVLVDGKRFFGDDAAAALKTLPAEIVDKIEIFDQKSEQSEFTGFDDGNTTKTINIVTKVDRKAGQFGKLYAGYGLENHYNTGGNFSIFNGNQRISFIGQSNDINIQNFSSEDILGISGSSGGRGGRGGGGWGRSNDFTVPQSGGITQTHALGVNFSDSWGKKTELTASYFVNRGYNISISSLERIFYENENDGTQEIYGESNENESTNTNHRFNARLEHKFNDKTSINIRPRISYQGNNGYSASIAATNIDAELLNNSIIDFEALNKGWNINNNFLLRHKINKEGRTISFNMSNGYNDRIASSTLYSLSQYFEPVLSDDITDQIATLNETGWDNSFNLTYTEPVSKKGMLSVEYRLGLENEDADKETFSAEESGAYSQLENALSSVFQNDYITHTGGLSYNYRAGKSMLMTRASIQYANLQTDQQLPFDSEINRSFTNFLPFVMWRYNIDRQNNIRLIYRTNTRKPTLSQLQEVVDNSNPLQIKVGNPALDQQYQHSMFMRLRRSNTETGTVLFALIGGNYNQNYIGTSLYNSRASSEIKERYNLQPGAQLSQNVNLDGNWDVRSFLTYGFPFSFIKSNINLNLSNNFSNTPGLINDELNEALNSSYGVGVGLSSNISEKIDFSIGTNSNINFVRNSLNLNQNTQYYSQNSNLNINWILPADLVFRTDLNNQLFTGLSDGFNQNFWIWNMAIGKKILKGDLGEINISVYDLLNQNQRINREITGIYIQDSRTNVLQRFVMVNFIYNFRNFKTSKKSNNIPGEGEGRDFRGGDFRGRGE